MRTPGSHSTQDAAINAAAFAAPASVDLPASRPLDHLEPFAVDECLTPQLVFNHTGITLRGPWRQKGWRNVGGTHAAVAIMHAFSDPISAVGEFVFLTDRLPVSRRILREAAAWLAFDLGLSEIFTRIDASNRQAQDIARRAGFTYRQPARLDSGAAASLSATWPPRRGRYDPVG